MLQIAADLRFIDISHHIAPQDVMEAAFLLQTAVWEFPAGTVHLVVVDPGVGTDRRPVALRKDDHWFVGPDNGVFSLLLDGEEPDMLVEIDEERVQQHDRISTTFHGRDVFAPAAAILAAGASLSEIGEPSEELQPLHWALPIPDEQGIRGWIVHVDHFGNSITNISRELFEKHRCSREVTCYVGNGVLKGLHDTYGTVEKGEPLLLFGSSGYLEVAVNAGNAASLLNIRKGNPVNVVFMDRSS